MASLVKVRRPSKTSGESRLPLLVMRRTFMLTCSFLGKLTIEQSNDWKAMPASSSARDS